VTGLWGSAAAVAGILLGAGAIGFAAGRCVARGETVSTAERVAWGFAIGLLLLAGYVPACFALGIAPGWLPFLTGAGLMLAVSRLVPAPADGSRSEGVVRAPAARFATVVLLALLLLGVFLYLLRAMTEPMWATDFLAIWGWKGKTIFGAAALPEWTWSDPQFAFTHPEYPLGLPLLYAGISFLLGRWDDHAMALLFPAFQAATLLALYGWLRRRRVAPPVPLAAAAAMALFEPLYRAFTTGMAEVPLSFCLLLLGTALVDASDGESGAERRLALAAVCAAGLKNEGLFVAGAAALLALAAGPRPWARRLRIAAAALLPAAAVYAAHRARTGPLPLRDFDLALLRSPDFFPRLLLGLRTILAETVVPAAPGILALGLLLAAGRRDSAGDRLLALAAIPLAAYAVLPAFCVFGPDWLARTAFARTAAALAPLAAAGVALRLGPTFGKGDGS
jgi:hypothetical protein